MTTPWIDPDLQPIKPWTPHPGTGQEWPATVLSVRRARLELGICPSDVEPWSPNAA